VRTKLRAALDGFADEAWAGLGHSPNMSEGGVTGRSACAVTKAM
jgi:hypothetical protein